MQNLIQFSKIGMQVQAKVRQSRSKIDQLIVLKRQNKLQNKLKQATKLTLLYITLRKKLESATCIGKFHEKV